MGTTTYLKSVKPVSEQDASKVATYNVVADDYDAAIAGMLTLSVSGSSNVTLSRLQAINSVFKFTGTLTGSITIFFPVSLGCARVFTVWNATSGAFTLTIKTTAGGSAGVVVTQTKIVNLFHDGTDVKARSAEV